jgi:hypothetical protein
MILCKVILLHTLVTFMLHTQRCYFWREDTTCNINFSYRNKSLTFTLCTQLWKTMLCLHSRGKKTNIIFKAEQKLMAITLGY